MARHAIEPFIAPALVHAPLTDTVTHAPSAAGDLLLYVLVPNTIHPHGLEVKVQNTRMWSNYQSRGGRARKTPPWGAARICRAPRIPFDAQAHTLFTAKENKNPCRASKETKQPWRPADSHGMASPKRPCGFWACMLYLTLSSLFRHAQLPT